MVAEAPTCSEQTRKGQLPQGRLLGSGQLLLGRIEVWSSDFTEEC